MRLGVLTREVVRNVKNCDTHDRIARVGRSERSKLENEMIWGFFLCSYRKSKQMK